MITTFILLAFELKSIIDRQRYSCKFYLKFENPKQRCSIFNIDSYLLEFWFLLLQVINNGTQQDLDKFEANLILHLKIKIVLVVVISLLPIIFTFYQSQLINQVNEKVKKIQVSDYTIMATDFDYTTFQYTDFDEYFTELLRKAGFDEEVKVLKTQMATAKYVLKKIKIKKMEAELEEKVVKRAKETSQFTDEEKDRVSKFEKTLKKRLKKLKFQDNFNQQKLKAKKKVLKNAEIKNSIAFFLISSPIQRDKILRAYSKSTNNGLQISNLCCKKKDFNFQAAPDPSIIVWRNIGIYQVTKYVVLFLQVIGTILIFVGILYVLSNINELMVGLICFKKSNSCSLIQYGSLWSFAVFLGIELVYYVGTKIIDKITSYSLFLSRDIASCNRISG